MESFPAAFCPQRGLVLDPFCGSGSTLVTARELGRDYVGIELDPDHHATSTARLREPAAATSRPPETATSAGALAAG